MTVYADLGARLSQAHRGPPAEEPKIVRKGRVRRTKIVDLRTLALVPFSVGYCENVEKMAAPRIFAAGGLSWHGVCKVVLP